MRFERPVRLVLDESTPESVRAWIRYNEIQRKIEEHESEISLLKSEARRLEDRMHGLAILVELGDLEPEDRMRALVASQEKRAEPEEPLIGQMVYRDRFDREWPANGLGTPSGLGPLGLGSDRD